MCDMDETDYMRIDAAIAAFTARAPITDADFTWMDEVTDVDREEFINTIRAGLARARDTGDDTLLERDVHDWRTTIEVCRDPEVRAALAAPIVMPNLDEDDWSLVPRPE